MGRHRRRVRTSFILLAVAAAFLVGSLAFLLVRFSGSAAIALHRAGIPLISGCGCITGGAGTGMTTALTLSALAIGAGALVILMVRFIALLLRTRRFISSINVVPASADLAGLSSDIGVSAQVREYDDERSSVFCAGLFKPLIYVPSSVVRTLDRSALQAVLEHERHHVLRRDPLRLLVADLVRIIPGFRPVVDEYCGSVELAADEEAIERMNGATALSRAMVRILSLRKVSRLADGAVAYFDATERRIDNLLGIARPPKRTGRVACLVASIIVAAAITIVGVRLPVSTVHAVEPLNGQCAVPPSCRMPSIPRTPVPWTAPTVTLLSTQNR